MRDFTDGQGFDIVLDDGGHELRMQQASFEALFPSMRPGGVYIVEDTHTSMWPMFGGSFLDYVHSHVQIPMYAYHMLASEQAALSQESWAIARLVTCDLNPYSSPRLNPYSKPNPRPQPT